MNQIGGVTMIIKDDYLHWGICCGYSLELRRQCDSKEYLQPPPTAYVYREEMWDIIDTNTIKYPPFLWGREFFPLLWKKFFLSDISICTNGVVFSKALC